MSGPPFFYGTRGVCLTGHRLFIFKRSATSLLRGIVVGGSIALNLTLYSLSVPITGDVSAYVIVSKQT